MELPEVIDLFSGCGGLALGFQKAGFKITHGIEIIPEAVNTVSYNLDWRFGKSTSHIIGDITKLKHSIFENKIGKNGCIVIGGPPCQAYSRAGKGKLRSLGEHRINTNDSRGYLYEDFIRFAINLNARAVIMENVPESINYGGINIPQLVCEILGKEGYEAIWTILNAADYGVPQIRERVFVIAIKKSENLKYQLPIPTHRPKEDTKTINELRFKNMNQYNNFRIPNKKITGWRKWVTVGEALSDLPRLFKDSKSKYNLYKLNIELDYYTEAQNKYQRMMRRWYGNELSGVTGNAFRNTRRDFRLFEAMEEGDDYYNASLIADRIFYEALRLEGVNEKNNKLRYDQLYREIVPPYNRDTFVGKWRKLKMSEPSHTLVAHLSQDTYSHIHPFEPRGISVREAARLQSFPDDFFFQCSMGEAFKQIGNAVPPLLAKGVADSIKSMFKNGRN